MRSALPWDSEDPWRVVRQFSDAVVPGSYLGVTHMTNEAHPEAAEALFRMTQELPWNTPLISRSRADIGQFFDRFTLVEPGLVTPGEWRPDLDNPLRAQGSNDSEGPVIHPLLSELPRHDDGIAWHFCGIGVKD